MREGLLILDGKDSYAGWTPRREGLSGRKTPRRDRLLGKEDSSARRTPTHGGNRVAV